MAKEPIVISLAIDDPLSDVLGRAMAGSDDLTPAMKDIAVHLESATRLRFETGKGPGGKPWKPSRRVAETAVGSRGPQRPTGQTLVDSGDLKSSITSRYGDDFAEVGSERSFGSAIYAAIHQFGGVIRPKTKKALSFGGRLYAQVTMPARPYLGFDDDDREAIVDILRRYVAGLLGGAGASGGAS